MEKKPAIRFENYTEDWEQRKLKEVADFSKGQGYTKSDLKETGTPIILYGRLYTKYQPIIRDVDTYADVIDGAVFSKGGEVILPSSGETAEDIAIAASVEKSGFLLGGGLNIVFPHKELQSAFLAIEISSGEPHNDLAKKAQGKSIVHLYNEDLKEVTISFPTREEQAQISTYFDTLDRLITLHQRNYEQMVATKESMLDKLFPQDEAKVPAIRFEGFVGDWEKKPLRAIVLPYSDPVEVPHNGYERLGIRSHGKGVFHEYVEAGKEITTAQLHRVAAHNLIVNITFAWEHAVAVTSDEDAGKLVSHRFPQFSMADGIHDQFLKYLILDARFRHHLLLSSPGGAGRNRVLKIPEMLEYEIRIPNIEEQKQIAGYLNSLDDLIELYRIRVEKLKNIKAACLQGMFV